MDASRITNVGSFLRKSRFDEIPQLYNILMGDMSLLAYGRSGYAQINFSYGASQEDGLEKLQCDLFYLKNYSLSVFTGRP